MARFLANADEELARLGRELRDGSYQPLPFAQFRIRDPKPRTISCADFRDRVVHHALCDVCGPFIERRFIVDSYACRIGKGAHRAVVRAQHFARRHNYFLKADVQSFYDTVEIKKALSLIAVIFRERSVRDLWAVILRHPFPGQTFEKGLPIGSLTSQWTANLYLDGLDHRVREVWRMPGYVRYMDDFAVWSDDKDSLRWLRDQAAKWLAEERGLKLKAEATRVAPSAEGLPFLGLRVFPGGLRLQRGRILRLRRLVAARERAWLAGRLDAAGLAVSVQAATGILKFWGLRGLAVSDLDV